MQVSKSQRGRVREGGNKDHLKGLMKSNEKSAAFEDYGFRVALNHTTKHWNTRWASSSPGYQDLPSMLCT